MAIRQNSSDFSTMKSAITASLFHAGSSAISDFQIHCLSGSVSWCLFKADKANNTKIYKPGPGLPMGIIKVAKPIYQELCSESLLNKCTHGQIQNQNEMFNRMIWQT